MIHESNVMVKMYVRQPHDPFVHDKLLTDACYPYTYLERNSTKTFVGEQ